MFISINLKAIEGTNVHETHLFPSSRNWRDVQRFTIYPMQITKTALHFFLFKLKCVW